MRVRFILPALAEAETGSYRPIKYSLFPPLGLATLAGYLRPDDEIELFDQHVEKVPEDGEPDLVAIQVYITNAHRAYAMADRCRERGIFVVMGGLHPTSLPDEALRHADALVLGPAHAAWPEFLRDFRRNRKCRKIYTDECRTLDGTPPVRRDLIRRNNYLVPNSIVVSRGCPQSCDFCYTRNFFAGGKQFYTAPVDRTLGEIAALPGRHLFFLDDNLFGSPRFARALFDGMRGMGRVFQGAATVRSLQDDTLLEAAAKAGLRSLFIGFESLNPESLASCHKAINRIGEYAGTVRRLHDHGIMVNASFVFGLPADRADVFGRTVEWAVETGIETATFHLATPYPGTPFFRAMETEGRLLHRDWERYDTRHAVIRHDHMTPQELEAGYRRSYRSFYRWRNIFRSASHQHPWTKKLRHFGYTAAWKKIDPLWAAVIRLKQLAPASALLEKVLDS
ncbi:MAG: B12-binding domain-containing radical SAM protein [Lentisphaeria bacterium]|nr:B12-binding domain-containing radical SAM protein [Lentisphaeria bacterium]